jgi:hypothetical protein
MVLRAHRLRGTAEGNRTGAIGFKEKKDRREREEEG